MKKFIPLLLCSILVSSFLLCGCEPEVRFIPQTVTQTVNGTNQTVTVTLPAVTVTAGGANQTVTVTTTVTNTGGQTTQTTTSTSAGSEVIYITADQLYDEYSDNEIAADLKYKGKTLQLTIKINNISNASFSDDIIISYGFLSSIMCYFDSSWASQIAQLSEGQNITIQGTCTGYYLSVTLKDCILISY